MKTHLLLFFLAFLLLPAGAPLLLQAADQPAVDPGWPRVFKKNGKELTIYQPQVDSWENYKTLRVRFAIAVKPDKAKKPTFGVAEVEAETVVDQAARVVAVMPKKRDLRFPDISDTDADALRRIVEELHPPNQSLTLSLDRVLAYLNPDHQQLQHAVQLNLDPPKIFHSDKPAILVMIMGQPQLKPVVKDKNDLMFVANTNWDILYDVAGQGYYLLNRNGWLTTKDLLKGPWAPASNLPPLLSTLPDDDNWGDVRKNIPGKPVKEVPEVLISTGPAELILTQGDPTYRPVPGTKLMQMTNTDAVVFLNSGDAQYYFLTAGRWFRSASLDGPWAIASNDLPQDFARIPDDDPSAFVKASVPGTTDAKDAVLLASVPTTTSVDPNTPPKLKVVYSGQPNFQPIPSTTVQYATNTSSAVFLVNGAYYCCDGGVWYTANSPSGPWSYCTNVPAAIYTIPASHPTHNVTYVTVQDSTPSTVVYSQTAGYSGEYVAATGVLMFGVGMIAGALLENDWDDYYHYPVPYSYGWGACYNYAYGGYYRPPYANYYGPYRGAGFATAYNPVTGTYARGGYAYGPAGAAAWGGAYNPATGARAAGARVDSFYGSAGRFAGYNPATGTAVRGGYRSNAYGAIAGVQTNRGTGALAWNTAHGEGAVVKGRDGNVYAGRDGHVYHRDSNGNWSTNSGNKWQPVNRSEARDTMRERNLQRADTAQPWRSQVQSRAANRQDWPRMQQPSTNRQFGIGTRELDSQAFARSRGNQLAERQSNFAAQMQNRFGGSPQFGHPRWQGQPHSFGGGGRAFGGGHFGGGHFGGGLRR